jgi:hypothetical protein
MDDAMLSLFIMLGQTAEKSIGHLPSTVPPQSLSIAAGYDLALLVPDSVRRAVAASEAYQLLFVFEEYLRQLVVDVLSKNPGTNWWDKVPKDVQDDVVKLEGTDEAKSWMALGSRDRAALMTYGQLLKVIDDCWKLGFEELLRDKSLVQEARLITHLRNTICHMTNLSEEETERIRQVLRDWFRKVAP